MGPNVDLEVARWAADRYGVFSGAEALTLGMSRQQLDRRLARGLHVQLHPDVYRLAGAPDSWHGRLRAAVLAAGDDAYASHHAFARLFGLRGTYSNTPEITVVGTIAPVLAAFVSTASTASMPPPSPAGNGSRASVHPLGLLTLGARLRERGVDNAVHDAIKLGLTTPPRLEEILRAYGGRGRRGTVKFRNALKGLPPSGRASESGLELDAYRLIVRANLGQPELQHPIVDATGKHRRLDIAYPRLKVNLEYDGDRWHDETQDAKRDAALRALGWHVERFGAEDVYDDPVRMLRAIALVLEARSLSA